MRLCVAGLKDVAIARRLEESVVTCGGAPIASDGGSGPKTDSRPWRSLPGWGGFPALFPPMSTSTSGSETIGRTGSTSRQEEAERNRLTAASQNEEVTAGIGGEAVKTQGNVVWMQRSGGSDEELVAQSQAGDEGALTALITRFRSITCAIARHYFLRGGDQYDVIQEGLIGLFKSIRDFDSTTGTAFSAFAHLCITRQILTAVKAAGRPNHEVLSSSMSLDEPLSTQAHGREWEDYMTDSTAFDPADLVIAAEEIEVMRDCLTRELTPLESDVLALYLAGRSYEEIAEELRRHTKTLDNALQRVRFKLSRRLHQYELDSGGRQSDTNRGGEAMASPWRSATSLAV